MKTQRTPSILVLQLDSAKLEADGLDLVPFSELVASVSPGAQMTIVRGTTFDDLLRQLSTLYGQSFDVIAVIGHSNEHGVVLRLAAGAEPRRARSPDLAALVAAALDANHGAADRELAAALALAFAAALAAAAAAAAALASGATMVCVRGPRDLEIDSGAEPDQATRIAAWGNGPGANRAPKQTAGA